MAARVTVVGLILALSTLRPGPNPASAAGADAAAPASDVSRLQGTWRGRSPEGASLELVIQGNSSKSTIAGKAGSFVVEQDFKLDESTDPKGIDFAPAGKAAGDKPDGKPTPGIYKLEGDRLTVCLSVFGDKRPTRFAAGKDGGSLVVYARVVPKGTAGAGTGAGTGAAATGPLAALQGRWEGYMETAGKREDVVVEVDGSTLTLSKGKGADAKPVGKSQIKLVDAPASKQVHSKGIDFAPADAGNPDALKGVGLYQVGQDLRGWRVFLRPTGTDRPVKIDAMGPSDRSVVDLNVFRPQPPAATQPDAAAPAAPASDKPKGELPMRRPTPSRRPTPAK